MVDPGNEGVDAVLDVLGQLTYLVPPVSHLGVEILCIYKHLECGAHRTQLVSQEADLPSHPFELDVLVAQQFGELGQERLQHPPWRRSTEQPPPLLCCWMLCAVICESKQVMQWPSGCITNQNVKLVFVFKTSRLWFIDKSRFR